jgi:hypothetical protein
MSQVKIQDPDKVRQDRAPYYASGAISEGDAVIFDTTAADGVTVKAAPVSTVISLVVGFAASDAADGEKLLVIVGGVAKARVTGTVTVGHALDVDAATAGVVASGGAAAIGDRFIICEANSGVGPNLKLVQIV